MSARVPNVSIVIEPKLAKRETFAAIIDASTRTVDRLVARGLPSLGSGRSRRIDVESALAWLRSHPDTLTEPRDDDEAIALRAARRELARGTR